MEPILLNIPDEITTDRLQLRRPKFDDGVMINAAVVESATELARWMPWASPTPSADETEKWVAAAVAKFFSREQFHFLLFLKGTTEYLGTCGMHHVDWKTPQVEIGYWLRNSRCRQGYMAEAVRGVVDFAASHIRCRRIEIRCDAKTSAAGAVADRTGFTLEGVLRNAGRDHYGELAIRASTRSFLLDREQFDRHAAIISTVGNDRWLDGHRILRIVPKNNDAICREVAGGELL